MEMTTEEIFQRLRTIKDETDVIEMRLVNTRKHVEHTESELDNMKHVLFKGFHTANEKINQMDKDIHELAEKIDAVTANDKLEQMDKDIHALADKIDLLINNLQKDK